MAPKPYLVFVLDDQYYAVPVAPVRRVVRAVKLTRLAKGPKLLDGLLNFHGQIIPVIDIRSQLGLPRRSLMPSDRMIILETDSHVAAFIVDQAAAVVRLDPETTRAAAAVYPEMADYLAGVSKLEGRNVLIYNIDTLVPPREMDAIAAEIAGNDGTS